MRPARLTACLLACLLLAQALPGLLEVGSFLVQREQLTQRHCVNIAAPALDCRASCYLTTQLEAIGAELADERSGDRIRSPRAEHLTVYVQSHIHTLPAPKLPKKPSAKAAHDARPQLYVGWPVSGIDRPPIRIG